MFLMSMLLYVQRFPATYGAISFMCFMNSERQPSIIGAPSVQKDNSFSYLRPSYSKKEHTLL